MAWVAEELLQEQLMDQVSELAKLCLDAMVFLHDMHESSMDVIALWVHFLQGNVSQCLMPVELALLADLFPFRVTGPGLCAHGAFGLQARGMGTFV